MAREHEHWRGWGGKISTLRPVWTKQWEPGKGTHKDEWVSEDLICINNTQVSPPTTTTHLFSLGEFWLGLEKIYAIVQQSNYVLRLELQDWKDSKHYVEYSLRLGSHETNYTLHLAKTAGNVPEALPEHGDLMFSTWDHRAKGQLYCPESYSGISLMPILFSSKYPSTV